MEEVEKISQEQIETILFNREIGWQEIIYDLINTEQLDPWDINITILTQGFLSKIQEYEEMDFFVSSKVLFAASLLLRIKSELILSKFMRSIDEILFGKPEPKKSVLERMELEGEIPFLIPKSPMPRFRKVTLNELIESLDKAIKTENRRIKKEIVNRNALRETGISLPTKKYNINDRINGFHTKIESHFKNNSNEERVSYTTLTGEERENKILSFFPALQLETNGKIWLEQETHFEEIYVWLKHIFLKKNPNPYQDLILGEWSIEHIEEGEVLTE